MRGIEIQKEISGFFNIGLDIGKNTVGVLKYMIGYSRVYFLLLGSSGYYWVFPGISGYITIFGGLDSNIIEWNTWNTQTCLEIHEVLGKQRPKNLGSRVALLPRKFLRVRKVFARITEKPFKLLSQFFQNNLDFSRWFPIFQMIANFLEDFKTVLIFPYECQFSGWFQNFPDFQMATNFSDDFKTFWIFQMIAKFQMISKLSGFARWYQNFADFPDCCQFYRWFQNCPDFPNACQFSGLFRNFPDFPDDCQFSRRYQNFLDFPDDWQFTDDIKKLSGIFQVAANFLQKCPDFSRRRW